MLQFDKKGLANEILNKLEIELNWAYQAWKDTVISQMRQNEFKINADLDFEIKKETNMIISFLRANSYVLADSYGTGSLMLENNPWFEEYREKYWHNVRKQLNSKAIVGREKGEYVDVFGKKHKTSGSMEGVNLEGVEVRAGFKIKPVSPSYALQDAKKFLYSTYLPKVYELTVKNIDFGKFLIES